MFRGGRSFIGCLASLAAVGLAAVVGAPTVARADVDPSSSLVINEIYGAGGGASAAFQNDYIELYNKSGSAIDLTGYSVQYASAAGTNWSGVIPLSDSIEANDYYLVQGATNGAVGAALPTPNATSTVNLSGTNGNIALVSSGGALTCSTTACQTEDRVVDLVGYGSGLAFAGTAAAPAPSAANSISRTGFANTASNDVDFTAGAGSPTAGPPPPPPDDVGVKTIAELQGTGTASPFAGDIATTDGVVTAVYPTGGFAGYYIQTAGTGGDKTLTINTGPPLRAGSDAIFVFSPSSVGNVAVGDHVEVKGLVTEYFGLTEISVTSASDQTDLAPATAPLPITAPWPTNDVDREKIEGMLYTPTGMYTVTDTFSSNQYGEVALAFGATPLKQPTDIAQPTASAPVTSTGYADAIADNAARLVTLDDGATTNFLTTTTSTPPYLSLTDPLRVGATPTFNTNVIVDYRNSLWKFQPLAQVTDATPPASRTTFSNTRAATPAAVGGDIKIASFNVLNYFTTGAADYITAHGGTCSSYNDRAGTPITINTCSVGNGPRGAWDATNLARQQAKTVAAILALDADVVGLMEMENSGNLGEAIDEATQTLVDALNAATAPGTWAFVPSSAELPAQPLRDVITNAIIYRPASVTPLGVARALGTLSDTGGAFDNAREPIAQAFDVVGGGEPFLFVVNHFKSKGSAGPLPGDADQGDGQGASNASRVAQSTALRDWVPTVLTAGVEDVFMVGDYNSYTEEDPLYVLYSAGYTDVDKAAGQLKSSYSFGKQDGSLDHVLANVSAMKRITGADIWRINSPESVALEYSRFNYNVTNFYAADQYRASDHDPVVVGLDSNPAATTQLTFLNINDFHGRIQKTNVPTPPTAPAPDTVDFATTVEQLRAAGGEFNTALLSAGDNISASLFASAVQADQPTIDVLNALDLKATATGNHEFDKGYDDLVNRVIDNGNNAKYKILGANVYFTGTDDHALDSYSTFEMDGLTIGVIGAVTEETPSLVSPLGTAGLEFRDPVASVNLVADQLTDGNPANGEADVLIAEYHEGAGAGLAEGATIDQEVAEGGAFADIVNLTSPKVAAVFTGHTHKVYAWEYQVPGAAPGVTRPIVQTGEYGNNVGKVVLTVDSATGVVSAHTQEIVAVTPNVDENAMAVQYPRVREVKHIVDQALAYSAIIGNQPKGSVTADITTAFAGGSYVGGVYAGSGPLQGSGRDDRASESTLGNTVADALVSVLSDPDRGGATIGVVNPGGLRAELYYAQQGTVLEGDGVVTYAEGNGVLPFVNNLWTTTLSGAQFKTLLEQQWQRTAGGTVPSRPYLQLGLSSNVTYAFDPTLPEGSRITSITIDGAPYDPAGNYRIGTFSFLATGGDNFHVFKQGADTNDSGLVDRDAWIDEYLVNESPLSPDFARQSVQVTPTPATATVGANVTFAASKLNLTSLGSPENTTLDVALGGVPLGTVAVAGGIANVDLPVLPAVPTGAQSLVLVAHPSNTTVTIPVTVAGAPDTTPPAAPAVSAPTGGTTSTTATPQISGTAEPGSTVTISDNGAVIGSAVADGAGHWTFTPTTPLADGAHSVTATATDAAGNTSTVAGPIVFTVDTTEEPPPSDVLTPVDPQRILDSRPGGVTYDNQFAGIGIQTAGTTLQLDVAGRAGVPADAKGVVLNVTATGAEGVGYVTAWPCGETQPTASSLNFDPSATSPNAVVTAIGDDGKVCLFTAEASVHLIADVNGFVPAGSAYEPLNPARLADSRDGAATIDGEFLGAGPRAAGSTWAIDIAGRGGVADDAETASLNVTVTGGQGTGYVTVWPCDADQPTASSLNFVADQNVPNAVITKLAADGSVCVFVAEASAHVIVDVNGYFPPGSGYGALNPARLMDTRDASTIDGQFVNIGAFEPGEFIELDVTGRGGVPLGATGVVLNVTSADATGTGYVTVWPCTDEIPNVSTVNFVAGVARPNASLAKLSDEGTVCLLVMEASSDLIVDVTGYLGS